MANWFTFIIVSLMIEILDMPTPAELARASSLFPTSDKPRCFCEISLSNDGPVYAGGNITFTSKMLLHEDTKGANVCDKIVACKYDWKDNYDPSHHHKWSYMSDWTVSYPADAFKPGMYTVEVRAECGSPIWMSCSNKNNFELKRTNVLIMIQ